VTERPILFSAPMVRAILEGRKTQTRRIVKPQPDLTKLGETVGPQGQRYYGKNAKQIESNGEWQFSIPGAALYPWRSPYGQPGDRLWVRETFYCDDGHYPDGVPDSCQWREVEGKRLSIPLEEKRAEMLESMYYRADGEPQFEAPEGPIPWRPSIFMPRWASRITLEVTGVRVERLQSISEADAAAEGVYTDPACPAYDAYRVLWDQINAKLAPWASNPWVWVIEFKRVTP